MLKVCEPKNITLKTWLIKLQILCQAFQQMITHVSKDIQWSLSINEGHLYIEAKVSFYRRDIIMYFDDMVHERVTLKQRCPLIRSVVNGRDHIIVLLRAYCIPRTKYVRGILWYSRRYVAASAASAASADTSSFSR